MESNETVGTPSFLAPRKHTEIGVTENNVHKKHNITCFTFDMHTGEPPPPKNRSPKGGPPVILTLSSTPCVVMMTSNSFLAN